MDATTRSRARIGVAAGIAGAVVAIVLGFLTFGVQSTAAPRELPLALAVPDGPAGQALVPLAARLAEQGGDAVDWQVTDPAGAAVLLDDAEIYGFLALSPAPDGRGMAITTTTSAAVNPSATAVATQILGRAGGAIAQAVATQTGTAPPPVEARTVHPAAPAATSLPLSATALLWLAALGANVALLLLARRAGRRPATGTALLTAAVVTVAAPAVVYGFAALWGLGIDWTWQAVGFLALVAGAFALVQAAVLRVLGIPGIAVLALVYLTAPAVAGLAPEMLNPAYRILLWSWTPIRFSADALRTLFFSGGTAPALTTGIWVFAGLAVAGLLVLALPRGHRGDDASSATDARTPAAVG